MEDEIIQVLVFVGLFSLISICIYCTTRQDPDNGEIEDNLL